MDSLNNNSVPVNERFRSAKWLKSEGDVKDFTYEPEHFIRTHCKGDSITDSTTQVWDVVFEPGQNEVAATCGGRYLCVFNVRTGKLLMKYTHKEWNHEMYSLSWTELGCGNMLASGSSCGEIRLYHPARQVSFYSWNYYKHGVAVSAVQFHHTEPTWLFAATNDSVVTIWNIGDPSPPRYTKCKHVQLLKLAFDEGVVGDIYTMAWVEEKEWVMVGTMHGLFGWKIMKENIKGKLFPKSKPKVVQFSLPGVSPSNSYVDSLCSIGDGLVAAKAVGYGKIYVFRAQGEDFGDKSKRCHKVEVLIEFGWLKTSNFYMNIGGSTNLGIIGCGDDEGSIWIYKLPSWLTEDESKHPESLPQKIIPLGRILWPQFEEVPVGNGATLLNKVAFSPCGKFIVGVTNNNIVAMWKKQH